MVFTARTARNFPPAAGSVVLTLYVDSDTMTVVGAGVVPEGQRTEVLFDTKLDERDCPGGHALSKTLILDSMTTYTILETANILAMHTVVHKATSPLCNNGYTTQYVYHKD